MALLTRRALVLSPVLLAACGGDPEPPRPSRGSFPPLRYGYLPPLNLNIQRLAMGEGFVPPAGEAEVSPLAPVNVVDTLFAMARDRLKPAGTGGLGTFRIQTASITRRGGTLNGTLAVRLDLRDAEESRTGFVEARVTAAKTGIPDQRAALYDMLKSLMDEMNVELEYQIKRELRGWLVETKSPEGKQPEPKRPEPSSTLPLPPPPPPPPPSRS